MNSQILDTIDIGASIDQTGKQAQVTIISPKWRISGAHIILDGETGKNMENAKNGDQNRAPQNGEDGKRELPGGPGGNFLGLGNEFINGKMMKIQSNGGNGGTGRNGGRGGYFIFISNEFLALGFAVITIIKVAHLRLFVYVTYSQIYTLGTDGVNGENPPDSDHCPYSDIVGLGCFDFLLNHGFFMILILIIGSLLHYLELASP